MKILFALNLDVIQANLINILRHEGIDLDFDPERDSVFSKDLIIEKVKYNLNSNDPKYEAVVINEKLHGEYDLIEIVRFLSRNNVRPVLLLGKRNDDDPLIHALIKRKVYDFLYGKLNIADIVKCIITPRRYEDIEYLVDINAPEYRAEGKGVIDIPSDDSEQDDKVVDVDASKIINYNGPSVKPPEITDTSSKKSNINFPKFNMNKSSNEASSSPTHSIHRDSTPERVVVQQNYIAQLPDDYKKNIVIYSNQQVGKSFVACNLATILAAKGKKTVLVDLDFKNKSQYYYFDMSKFESHVKDSKDMNILARTFEFEGSDFKTLSNYLFSPMKNLYVITSHPDLEVADYDIDTFFKVYMMLKNNFDVVIYDVPGVCGEEYLKFLMTEAEDIFIITNQNCSILDRTEKDFRDVLNGYYVNNKVSLIINQYIEHKELTKASIRDHLSVIETRTKAIEFNFKNVFIIPNNYVAVVEGIAKGKPAVTFDEELKRVFENIASKYYPDVDTRRGG